jgi:hypothetical protein
MVGERQGNNMVTAWEWHGMCESALVAKNTGNNLNISQILYASENYY